MLPRNHWRSRATTRRASPVAKSPRRPSDRAGEGKGEEAAACAPLTMRQHSQIRAQGAGRGEKGARGRKHGAGRGAQEGAGHRERSTAERTPSRGTLQSRGAPPAGGRGPWCRTCSRQGSGNARVSGRRNKGVGAYTPLCHVLTGAGARERRGAHSTNPRASPGHPRELLAPSPHAAPSSLHVPRPSLSPHLEVRQALEHAGRLRRHTHRTPRHTSSEPAPPAPPLCHHYGISGLRARLHALLLITWSAQHGFLNAGSNALGSSSHVSAAAFCTTGQTSRCLCLAHTSATDAAGGLACAHAQGGAAASDQLPASPPLQGCRVQSRARQLGPQRW